MNTKTESVQAQRRAVNLDDVAVEKLTLKFGASVVLTNDPSALEEAGYSASAGSDFAKAWRIFGNLVYWGNITVNFSDPGWARQVMYTIQNIAEELARDG